jgi:hypothetical protein
MKLRFAILALVALVAVPAVASAQEKYLEMLRNDLKAEKTALLTEGLHLTDAESQVFWPIQRQYELDLSKIQDARIALVKEYIGVSASLTPEQAKSIATRALKLEGDRTSLKKKYFDTVSKKVSPTVAARYLQLETYIQTLIDVQVQGEMPAVP